MATELTNATVDIVTRDCRHAGSVPSHGYRLSDVLNNPGTDVLEMHDVLTTTQGSLSKEIRWKELCLRKDRILLVIPKGKYEAPARRCNLYMKKNRYGAMIAIPGCILSGIVHLPRRATAMSLLGDSSPLPPFIGITDVTVQSASNDLLSTHYNVAIVRRRAIEAVQLTHRPLADQETSVNLEETSLSEPCLG